MGIEKDRDALCLSRGRAEMTLELLSRVDKAMAVSYLPYVIAGGAVRDCFFGLVPKDIDVFVDVSGMDNPDDAMVLLCHDVFIHLGLEDTLPYKKMDSVYEVSDKSQYYIYNSAFENFTLSTGEMSTTIQLIGKADPSISRPEEMVQSFDYELVRAWYKGGLQYSGDFCKAVKARQVTIGSARTRQRVDEFITRAWPKCDFKIF